MDEWQVSLHRQRHYAGTLLWHTQPTSPFSSSNRHQVISNTHADFTMTVVPYRGTCISSYILQLVVVWWSIYLWYDFENNSFKITATFPRGQWVKKCCPERSRFRSYLWVRLLRTSDNLWYYQRWLRSWPNENWLGTVRISSCYTFLQIV